MNVLVIHVHVSQNVCQIASNQSSSNTCQITSNKSASHTCYSSKLVSCENRNSESGETVKISTDTSSYSLCDNQNSNSGEITINTSSDSSQDGSAQDRNSNITTETLVEKVKCFYTNVDQLRNKLDELKMQISLEGPDFIFVTEVLPKVDTDLDCLSV